MFFFFSFLVRRSLLWSFCVYGGEGGGGRAGGGKGKEMSQKKKKKKEMTRRDSPNSSNPLTVSMVGAARMVLLK